jgi:carbon-monoxide dehydrogenase large subunit
MRRATAPIEQLRCTIVQYLSLGALGFLCSNRHLMHAATVPPTLRREDAALLRGTAQFGDDVPLPDALHIAFVRSTQAHAELVRMDAAAALHMPGVRAVLTAQELGRHAMPAPNALLPLLQDTHFELLAHDTVAYVGQAVAVVVAHSQRQARAAAAQVRLTLQALPAVGDFAKSNPAVARTQHHHGALPHTAPSASVRLQLPRLTAMPMEPRACSAAWHADAHTISLWMATQTPSRAQADVARVLGLQTERVHLVCPNVGGAFGARASVSPEDLLVALVAQHLRATVRWTATRSEDFLAGMQGRAAQLEGQLWVDEQGHMLGLAAQLHFSLGAWLPYSAVVPLRNAARILPGPYNLARVHVDGLATRANTAPVNIYRGAGRPEAALLVETLIDTAARRHGIDPVELRLKNLVPAHAMPFTAANGEVLDSGDYPGALRLACLRFGYQHERAEQARRRSQGEWVGLGVAMYIEPCGQGWESARVTLHGDARVTVASGSPAQGQGHATTYARIAADQLGCAPDQIEVLMGDSHTCPVGIGALASRSTAIAGSAIVQACASVQAQLQKGAPLPITAEERFTAQEAWSYGCVLVRLAIDADTGKPRIERLVWVDDAGNIVEPALAHGQLVGGAAQGLGQALMEHIRYDDLGQLLTGSLMDYALPRASDMPDIDIVSVHTPSPHNPLGAKGVGEAGCIGIPAALMNAARDALSPCGEPAVDFPLTPETLWRAMHTTPTTPTHTPTQTPTP